MKKISGLLLFLFSILSISAQIQIAEYRSETKIDYSVGLYDLTKGEILPCIYEKISSIKEDSLYIVQKDGKCGVLDIHSNSIVPFEYDNIRILGDRLLRVQKEGKYGVINLSNKMLVSFDYDNFKDEYQFSNTVTVFSKNGKWGLVSNTNEVVLPFDYDNIYADADFARIVKNKKQGIVNRQGKIIIKPLYDEISSAYGYIEVVRNKKHGLCNSEGRQLIPMIYDNIFLFYAEDNIFMVERNRKYGLVNSTGKVLVPIIYDDIDILNSHKAIYVKKNGKTGLVDKSGKIIIPLIYDLDKDNDTTAGDNLFAFKQDEKWGVVNNQNDVIVPFEYEKVRIMKVKNQTCIEISKDKKWGLLDSLGKEKIPMEYNYFSNLPERNNYFMAQKESRGLFGIISESNKIMCAFNYSKLNHSHADIYTAWIGSSSGIINCEGEKLSAFEDGDSKVFRNGLYARKQHEQWAINNYITDSISSKKYDAVKYLSPNKLVIMIRK